MLPQVLVINQCDFSNSNIYQQCSTCLHKHSFTRPCRSRLYTSTDGQLLFVWLSSGLLRQVGNMHCYHRSACLQVFHGRRPLFSWMDAPPSANSP